MIGAAALALLILFSGLTQTVSASQAQSAPSLAVMPFNNRGGGENSRYFANGLQEDLLSALSSVHSLRVISRESVMAYRDPAISASQIGEELQAAYLLEGVVQQGRDRIRIDIRLVEARPGDRLWEKVFDRKLTTQELFGIRREIVRSVAQSLALGLDADLEQRLGQTPTASLEAYRAVLAARQLSRDGGPDAFERSRVFAREAIALDPSYSDAHLALALALEKGKSDRSVSNAMADPEIQASIDKALSLDPANDGAWSALGRLRADTGQPGAEDAFEKALRLNPSGVPALYAYGRLLVKGGRLGEALPFALRANDLDPRSIDGMLLTASIHDALADYGEARAVYARIREIDPSNPLGYARAASSFFPEGRLDEALQWLRRAQETDPADIELGGWMVFLNDCLEDFDASGYWSDWLERRITRQPLPMAMKARHHYLTGNFQMALQYANLAIRLDLEDRWNSDSIFMRIKRDEALAYGDPNGGITVFAERHPELLEAEPQIAPGNILQATDLAQLLKLAGRGAESRRLLLAVIDVYEQPGFTNGSMRAWLAPVKAQALAILGERKRALEELRRIIDGGWRVYWRWETDLNANFNSIREDIEYRAIVSELEADMAEQRTRGQAAISGGGHAAPGAGGETGRGDG